MYVLSIKIKKKKQLNKWYKFVETKYWNLSVRISRPLLASTNVENVITQASAVVYNYMISCVVHTHIYI